MKITNWKVSVLHPINQNVLEENTFRNIEDCANHYSNLPLSTWRNISIGRSKIYEKFIKLEKVKLENKMKQNKNNNFIQEKKENLEDITETEDEIPLNIISN